MLSEINVRESRLGNQERTVQRNWQCWVHKTQQEDKVKQQQKHNTNMRKKHK